MFVQILQGTCHDAAGARRLMDRWVQELAPGASGWLGTTAGVAQNDELIAVVRFASEQDARANSDRPEQGAWWTDFSKHFDGDVAVHDCATADQWMGGGSDDAGFVQVMQSQVLDRERAQALMQQMARMGPGDIGRNDVIGGTFAWHSDDDGMTQVVYFTSEEDARRGEQQEPPQETQQQFEEFATAFSQPRYLDLTEPWLYSPR